MAGSFFFKVIRQPPEANQSLFAGGFAVKRRAGKN